MALDKNSQIKKRKIAMIGTASSWKDAPYNDKDWEIWALNGLSAVIPRFDRYFNVHNYNLIEEQYDKNHLEFLRKCEDRLYLNNSYSELPKAVVYPLEKITKKYLSSFLLDKSKSEQRLLNVWMEIYKNQVDKGIIKK